MASKRTSDALMSKAALSAILVDDESCVSIPVSSSSKVSSFSDASSRILSSSLGLCGITTPSVKTGGESGAVMVKRRYIKWPVNFDCAY